MEDKAIFDGEGLTMLPVWMQGARNLLDVIWLTSDDDVDESVHLRITHKGLLECFLLVWGQASMMNGNVQRDVKARKWTEAREGIRQDHFLTRVVMENVVIALETQ